MSDAVRAEYKESYAKFATKLSTWFVAYGVGAPALLATNAKIWDSFDAGSLRPVVLCFITGLALQAVLSLVYKWAQWELYKAEPTDEEFQLKLDKCSSEEDKQAVRQADLDGDYQPKLAALLSKAYFVDFLVDLGTIIAYALGTYLLLLGLVGS